MAARQSWNEAAEAWREFVRSGADFLIKRPLEPKPTGTPVRTNPQLEDCARLRYFLIVDAMLER